VYVSLCEESRKPNKGLCVALLERQCWSEVAQAKVWLGWHGTKQEPLSAFKAFNDWARGWRNMSHCFDMGKTFRDQNYIYLFALKSGERNASFTTASGKVFRVEVY
jgi:hypothetical protein